MNLVVRVPNSSLVSKVCFHTSGSIAANVGRVMTKIMKKSKKIKSHEEIPVLPSPVSFSKGSNEGKTEDSRRGVVLNKLFMRHITDLMATGEYATEIIGLGIEISRVKISSEYNFLKVFWFSRSNLRDDVIQNVLSKNAGYLRHELSQLRVMGNVPSIVFVKDNHYGSVAEVDKRLAVADFGEDYVPLDTGFRLKSEFQLYKPLEDHIKEKIQQLDAENDTPQVSFALPVMTHNIYGVDHAKILERVKKGKKPLGSSYSDEFSNKAWAQFKVTQTVNEDPVGYDSEKAREAAFRDFLRKHESLRTQSKIERRYNPDLEYLKEEHNQKFKNYLENISYDEGEDFDEKEEDYITEDVDKKY